MSGSGGSAFLDLTEICPVLSKARIFRLLVIATLAEEY